MKRRPRVSLSIAISVMLSVAAAVLSAAAGTASAQGKPVASAAGAANYSSMAELQAAIDLTISGTTGGVQISEYEIAWDGGAVIMSFPLPGQQRAPALSPAARASTGMGPGDTDAEPQAEGCLWNPIQRWYCFFEHDNYRGVKVQFTRGYCSPALELSDYGFNNRTTSWVNNKHVDIYVYDGTRGTGTFLYQMEETSRSPNVGTYSNDRATSVKFC